MAPKLKKTTPGPKSQHRAQGQPARSLTQILTLPAALLTLAALASPISQAALAPVFGGIPSSINHSQAMAATPLLGFLWRWSFKNIPPRSVVGYLAVWAFWIPVVSAYLFRQSASLGIVYGPAVIGFLSCHGIVIPAAYAAAEALEELHLEDRVGSYAAPLLLALLGDFHVVAFEKFFHTLLPGLQTLTGVFTPVKSQALIASSLSYLSHSKLALLGIPALIHTFSANPHFDSARTLNTLNNSLLEHNWSIIARQWSSTGYISILDNLDSGFRIMRADHSLLGGEWRINDQRREKEGWLVNEPIYAVFEMLEAVRLVPTEPPILDAEAQALIIGLGIGTAPKAFLAHGINTTVIELDPAVHEYAVKYFDLPTNHTPIIQDAVSAVAKLASSTTTSASDTDSLTHPPRPEKQYDYIIHDVFTGGAEPLALFTHSFLLNLRALLKPHALIAINYAGSPDSPLTIKVLRTIRATFGPSCRAFRDSPPTAEGETGEEGEEEDIMSTFANMVIFCRSSAALPQPISFREPTEADFLGRKSARQYLLPREGYEVVMPRVVTEEENERGGAGEDGVDEVEDEGSLLVDSELGEWTTQQMQSAIRHWRIMRRVLPDVVWELW